MKDYDRLTFAKSDTKKPLARRLGGGMRLFGILGIMRLVPHQQLQGVTFPEILGPDAVTVPPASQEGPGAAQLPAPVQNDLGLRLDRLERSLVEVQGAARPNWWWFAVGLLAGLGFAAIAELFALVAKR